MASQEVELFDIASRGSNTCWSLNPWSVILPQLRILLSAFLSSSLLKWHRKTRLVLNLKKIPYKTTWLEYPEIAPTLKGIGLPPNDEGIPYTIPAVRLPDGTPVMDSRKIAPELEKLHPSPNLHLDSAVLPQVEEQLKALLMPTVGVWMPKIPRTFLKEPSITFFEKTRAERFGCTLSELEKKTPEDEAWSKAEPGIKDLGNLLKRKGGPFFLGETVSYADFVVVGALHFLKRIDTRYYDRIVAIEPAFNKLYEACERWLERDSH